MIKKIIKYILRGVLVLVGIVLLIPVLVYIPFVQDFIKKEATAYVSENFDISLSIDKLRLGFPLNLTVENTTVITTHGDTLFRCGELKANVALLPLFRKEVVVNRFAFSQTAINYKDSLSGMVLIAQIGKFTLKADRIDLNTKLVQINDATLDDGTIQLDLGKGKTDTTAKDTAASLPWKIVAEKIGLSKISFRMNTTVPTTSLSALLGQGTLAGCSVDLGTQYVTADRVEIDKGEYSYLRDTTKAAPIMPGDTLPGSTTPPWTVRVGQIVLTDNTAAYGTMQGEPTEKLDFNHIQTTRLNLTADSLYNRGSEIDVTIRQLTLAERSGLEIDRMNGHFVMDSTGIRLSGFNLQTPNSEVSADAAAGSSILQMSPKTPLQLKLTANIGMQDVLLLAPVNAVLRKTLAGKTLTIDSDITGRLDDLDIQRLRADMPNHIYLRADGRLRSLLKPDQMSGSCRINGTFTNLKFLLPLLPDTALRNRINIPARMALAGTLRATNGVFDPNLNLAVDSGHLDLKAHLDLRKEAYKADLTVSNFPLNRFLPKDSLGLLTLHLATEGQGFDPTGDRTETNTDIRIERAEYKGYDYKGIALRADLRDHLLTGRLTSESEALQLALDLRGELRKERYSAGIDGTIRELDLHLMNLTREKISTSLTLNADLTASADSTYTAALTLDSILIRNGYKEDKIRTTSLNASIGKEESTASIRSGDLRLDFRSPTAVDSLVVRLNRSLRVVSEQVRHSDIDMAAIQDVLPPFSLGVDAGQNNILNNFLKIRGISFSHLSFKAGADHETPFNIRMLVDRLTTSGLVLDTLNVGAWQQDERLNYYLRLANVPGNIEQMALIALYGDLAHNTTRMNLYQQDRSGKAGFRFGLNATLLDSAIRVSLFPENPILGFETWNVNKDNYILYQFNKKIFADLHLTREGQHVKMQSVSLTDMPDGAIHADIAGIRIGSTLSLFPSAPPVDGILNTDVTLGMSDDRIAANGKISIQALEYDSRPIGDVDLAMHYQLDSTQNQQVGADLLLNGQQALTAKGRYRPDSEGGLDLNVSIPSFPLAAVDPFLPKGTAQLSGAMKGELSVTGPSNKIRMNGELQFTETNINVPMIGTAFGLSPEKIIIDDNTIRFNNFAVIAPNKQPLTIDGRIDMTDFSRISTDLTLKASDFQAVNVARNNKSLVYGKASFDLNTTVRGLLDELSIRGNIRLLNGTEITYVMRDSPLEVESREQNIVTFVSFSDTTAVQTVDSVTQVRIGGMDILMNVDIDNAVKAAVYLSEDGNNRINLQGGGNLSYTMNRLGDSRFAGRYVLSGGTVSYNPPIISQKVFDITEGSFVEWTGDIADPTLNITAVETVRTDVTTDDKNSRPVSFDISINIRNTLENLGITFDLSAPEDLTIQNQLVSLTPEQRSTQAMNLLIYNTYNGPGTTAKVNTSNPLNTFIAKELNQWARNNLKNVDVSFGVSTTDETSTGGTAHTDYSYKVSKNLFNDRVRVIVGGSISTDNDPTENLKDNFIDDISAEYRLTKRDNMFIKVFRQTGYESILEGEITQTGVGFVVRKKLMKLGDLFRLTGNKEKKAIRELRRAERKAEKRQDSPTEQQEGQTNDTGILQPEQTGKPDDEAGK